MKLEVVSFDGHALNNADYRTVLPEDEAIQQAKVRLTYIPMQRGAPVYGAKVRQERPIKMLIEMRGDPVLQIDELKSWFPVEEDDDENKVLILQDTSNGNKQWYWNTTVAGQGQADLCSVYMELMTGDGILRSVAHQTDSWVVTVSGTDHAVATDPVGNADAYPVITLQPTIAKTSGYAYKRLVNTYRAATTAHPNRPTELTNGGWDTRTYISDTSKSNQINNGAGIGASDTTIAIDTPVGGGLPITGGLCYVDTEQIRYTSITGGGTQLNVATGGRGWGGTTAATHLDNAVISWSHALANGNDVRVFMDGQEVPRWFGTGTAAWNQPGTKIWAHVSYSPGQTVTLGTSMAGTGSVGSVDVTNTRANKEALKLLPPTGCFLIGSEKFTYTGVDSNTLVFTGTTRAVDGTSMAAHSLGATITWLQHTIFVLYGNPDDDAPVIDNNLQPIIDLLNSTNGSWVYDTWSSLAGTRSGSWIPVIDIQKRDSASDIFTADHNTDADPYDDIGMRIQSYLYGSKYQQPRAMIAWQLYHPDGVSAINVTGHKYRVGAVWAGFSGLEVANDVKKWVTKFNEATPGSASTWTDFTNNGANALGSTYNWLRFRLSGSCSIGSGSMAAIEVDAATLTLVNYPTVSFGAEQSAYHINARITLVETGEYILVDRTVKLNEILALDCFQSLAYLQDDNSPGPFIVTDADRVFWLRLRPNQTNTIRYEDLSGSVGSVSVGIDYQDRAR